MAPHYFFVKQKLETRFGIKSFPDHLETLQDFPFLDVKFAFGHKLQFSFWPPRHRLATIHGNPGNELCKQTIFPKAHAAQLAPLL